MKEKLPEGRMIEYLNINPADLSRRVEITD
jgi:hypothetical protein